MHLRFFTLNCAAILALAMSAVSAIAQGYHWVQFGPRGVEARGMAGEGGTCPTATIDGKPAPMSVRAEPTKDFPIRVCTLPIPSDSMTATVGGDPLPLPVADPKRILVLGDTGCRLKGTLIQACNDPRAWPFRVVADVAAYMKPDLVIHVGDYHYRETACPLGNSGCAGTPFGDNWAVWNADFFAPAQRLLETAPWVFVRGNHEECNRGGEGWARTLDPRPFDSASGCQGPAEPYFVEFGNLRLAVFDVSTADEQRLNEEQAAVFKARFQILNGDSIDTWLLLHRPPWGVARIDHGQPIGFNVTLDAAIAGHLPGNVSLMLSGHLHTFEVLNYEANLPPQLIAGHGGDWLDRDVPLDPGGLVLNGVKVKRGLSMPEVFGFVILERQADGWVATNYDALGKPQKSGKLAERAMICN